MKPSVPMEYRHDAKLVTLYNTGFKDGYYAEKLDHPILDKQILTDEERLCYNKGRTAGQQRMKKELEQSNG